MTVRKAVAKREDAAAAQAKKPTLAQFGAEMIRRIWAWLKGWLEVGAFRPDPVADANGGHDEHDR